MSGSGQSENDKRALDIQGIIRRANGAQSGSTINFGGANTPKESDPNKLNLNRLGDYVNQANKKSGGATYAASKMDFNKLFNDYNLANNTTNNLSYDNLAKGLPEPKDLTSGYKANSIVSSTAKDFLAQMQTIFENRKQEILNRYQRPGGAQTDVKV